MLFSSATNTKNITVRHARQLGATSKYLGGRRYSFAILGQLNKGEILFTRGGRHDFVTGNSDSTGNVFLYGVSSLAKNVAAESHQRYSTGILWDNVSIVSGKGDGGGLVAGLFNRNNYGTGHGWSCAFCLAWNLNVKKQGVAVEALVKADPYYGNQSRPFIMNWVSGLRAGKFNGNKTKTGTDTYELHSNWSKGWPAWWENVTKFKRKKAWKQNNSPKSIYQAQLLDRMSRGGLTCDKCVVGEPKYGWWNVNK